MTHTEFNKIREAALRKNNARGASINQTLQLLDMVEELVNRSSPKILNLIVRLQRDWDEFETWVVPYHIRKDVASPEEALRGAVQDFVNSGTEESRQALEYACGDFNWGDVASNVPDEYFITRGLTPIKNELIEIVVDHDETLDNREG